MHVMYKHATLLCWAVLVCFLVGAGAVPARASGRITGKVTDQATGDALPGANVVIKGTSIGAATDLNGNFTIPNAPSGTQVLVVTYIGYQSQEREVVVPDGGTVRVDVSLGWQAAEGDEIVITAQAEGQVAAINQQLSSNTITNIVSAARIQELPDVNAAESIGRLPGVAIQRTGGEATRVSIRGLSPKYNTVTVNGVRVPSTGGDDRSVDLSLISSNMLSGIEVMKAITPDMDADAIGGAVDLKLREAPEKLMLDVLAQGGYNRIQDYYGNYKFVVNASNRFFDNRLGVIASFNIDEYDRSADKFNGGYTRSAEVGTGRPYIFASSIDLREDVLKRGRTGASAVLDYRIPLGKVTANAFFNQLTAEGLSRVNNMNAGGNRHYYQLSEIDNTTSIFTAAIGMEQDFGILTYDASLARTRSESESPDEYYIQFGQEGGAIVRSPTEGTRARDIPALMAVDTSRTGLTDMYVNSTFRNENVTMAQLNVRMPFRIGSQVNGYFKTGGKLRWLDRKNDEEQVGRGGWYYGTTRENPAAIYDSLQVYLPGWDFTELINEKGYFTLDKVLSDHQRTDFLDGQYDLGMVIDEEKAWQMVEAMLQTSDVGRNMAINSRGRDYDGVERYQAAYAMAEFNIGRRLTIIPGVRWERDYSRYRGQRLREVVVNNVQQAPSDLDTLTNVRKNSFWLPMVHVQFRPTNWATLRLARTETLTRPDYIQYAPITSINNYRTYVRAANADLKPAEATNYDAALSIYENKLGLFTVAGFYKNIKDVITPVTYWLHEDVPLLPGMNVPADWVKDKPQADTYINNPFKATYKGFEIDWQTNFWYLPSVFKGLVLNINYTRIFSNTTYQAYFLVDSDSVKTRRPLTYYKKVRTDSVREGRMLDQPSHIANVTLGYDYKGFSTRFSVLYQTDISRYIHPTTSVNDSYTGDYLRLDLSMSQKLGRGLEVFANFNNLNNRPDENFQASASTYPTYTEYYGFTMDLGARYRF